MSSQDVIKSTAKKLKYYMEVKRLEDAFDLSGPNHPQRHYPQLKPRPTLMYDGLHDRALKHYFRETRVRRQLNHMTCRPHTKREADVRKEVDKYMQNSNYSSPHTNVMKARAFPKKRWGNFKGGSVLMRSRHGPMLSQGEATRLVNNATRLLVATETVPLENMNESKYSAKVYRMNSNRSSLPSITGYEEPKRKSPTRPKSSYGIRRQNMNGNHKVVRPKSALGLTDKRQPSSARFGYDVAGRKIRLAKKTPQYYDASESSDAFDQSDDEPMNIFIPVNQAAISQANSFNQNPEWLSIQMSQVSVDDEEEEEPEAVTAKPDNPNLYSIDNTTQTGCEISTQTVEKENSKDTQTRHANSEECMTDPYQADMAVQTKPPPVTSSTQTKPPPPTIATQTIPPPPTISTQTNPIPPTISTQTMPEMATQTQLEMSTQTMISAEVQTPPNQGTQTAPPSPEIGIQVDPPPEEDDYEHMKHGPRLKSGRRSIYELAIHTGDRLGADTHADVFITLFGENGNTGKIKLKQPRETSQNTKAKFQRGQVDMFRVESFYVGKLECVEIGHDRKELGCAWFLEKVHVKEYQDDVTYEFLCEKWLSAQDDDGKTARTLPVGNITMDVSSDSETDSQHSYVESSPDSEAYPNQEPHHRRMIIVENASTGYDSDGSKGSHNSQATRSSSGTSSSETDSESESDGEDKFDTMQQNNRRDSDDSDSTEESSDSDSESDEEEQQTKQYNSRNNQDQRGQHNRSSSDGHGKHHGSGGQSDNQPVEGTSYQGDSLSHPRPLKSIQEVSEDGQLNHSPPSGDMERQKKNYMAGFEAGVLARKEREQKKMEEEEGKKEEERQKEAALLSGDTIHECCKKGNLARVKQLIQLKPDLKELTDERGFTPLLTASASGQLNVVKFLTISDADINKETPTGYTCLHLAAINGYVNVMMVLTAMGMSVGARTVDRQTPLHLAAMSGHLEACKWLVANRAMIDVRDTSDRTPLILAEEYDHEDVLSFLKSCHSELKKQDSSLSLLRTKSGTDSDALSDGQTSESWSASPRKSTTPSTTPSITSSKKKQKEEIEILLKRQTSFQQQQASMSSSGMSFLDSIRNEYNDTSPLA
ncbi:uncharacterized protein LOC117113275 [Anneissia japonica]|uniref:uncharacterized protein LOC117113275 n=1 Tax=Anneissia japonica TaxID=1529436 RepID=UPI001425A7B4|nr:uncharacterized protein LOC117113275 [Anneissia japonica]